MDPRLHNPHVLPMAELVDEWVVRCDCGCGLYEQFAQREEAEERAGAARGEDLAAVARQRGVDHTDTEPDGAEPI